MRAGETGWVVCCWLGGKEEEEERRRSRNFEPCPNMSEKGRVGYNELSFLSASSEAGVWIENDFIVLLYTRLFFSVSRP